LAQDSALQKAVFSEFFFFGAFGDAR